MMKMVKVVYEDKMKKRRREMRSRVQKHEKERAKLEERKLRKTKELKKEVYKVLGQIEKKKQKHMKD